MEKIINLEYCNYNHVRITSTRRVIALLLLGLVGFGMLVGFAWATLMIEPAWVKYTEQQAQIKERDCFCLNRTTPQHIYFSPTKKS